MDVKDRIIAERDDLIEKIGKLVAFINGKKYQDLSTEEKDLLTDQLLFMRNYLTVLEQRAVLYCLNNGLDASCTHRG